MSHPNKYTSFRELAEDLTDGAGELHAQFCPEHKNESGSCISWQHGVMDLAGWLDSLGLEFEVEKSYVVKRAVTAKEEE